MVGDEGGNHALTRVLLVDDDAVLASGVECALEAQGYVVQTVSSGAAAFEALPTFRPDLVVLDVMMPEMDGWQVLTRIREQQPTQDVPVIMLTAADTQAAIARGFVLGADDYVTKPFNVQELRLRISAVLRRSRGVRKVDEERLVPVVVGGKIEFVRAGDIFYVEGVHNYSYIHTANTRFLSKLTLGSIERQRFEGFRRVHRSFVVNMDHIKGCGWVGKSAYRVYLADAEETAIPVSRTLVADVQRELGLRQ